ncbi:hypothetical protein LTR37_008284 [Vermiconidia calcicola]|uniref:Uncharacterized protein n=1 Tax=Vermiconidia calcicola TaxID=1690605 RepID=A0ACC3NBC8_9PEZI|nr:hypothetical protein LTR37_008284 [Vermiconidia calcicola]
MSGNSSNQQQQLTADGSTSGWDPTTQEKIVLALGQNGGLNRIQATLKQRLDEAGWSQDLREYITHLFRSGAAVTYDDAKAIIMKRIQAGEADPTGAEDGVPAPKLAIPSSAQHDGADAVKKELASLLNPEK